MARNLNLKVIAEGVETEEQLSFLRARRCDDIQGFYFSPPLPPERIPARLLALQFSITNSQVTPQAKPQ